MAETRYRFTIRPASQFHCPEGWLVIQSLDPPQRYNYGTVTYPEPLDFRVASHFELVPEDGPRIVRLVVDGDEMELWNLVPDVDRFSYDLAVGAMSADEARARLVERGDSFGLPVEVEFSSPCPSFVEPETVQPL